MITYKYACWKCDEWHDAIANNRGDLAQVVADLGVAVVITADYPRRLRVRRDGKLWLIPWTRNRGILIGATGGLVQVLPWITAQWEFADHDGGDDEWNDAVLGGPRE